MELLGRLLWRAVLLLFAAFAVLAVARLSLFGHYIPNSMIWPPLAAAVMLFIVLILIDIVVSWWWVYRVRLQALCLGASIKPFDWALGDESHMRRPGGRLLAFGPLRLAWRSQPVPNSVTFAYIDRQPWPETHFKKVVGP